MNSGLSAGDIMALTKNNDGLFGDGIWGIIMLLIIAGLFSGNGFGWGNRGNLANDTLLGEEFVKRDIFNTNQNVSNTACQTQKEVLENRFNCSQNACNTQKEILESRYTTQLGFQNAQANLSNCCCDLKTAIHAEGEATRSMLQSDKIEQLRDQVYASNLALSNANLANTVINSVRPFPIPSYTVTSPYVGLYNPYNGCGCNNATII
jgi:hypothetical protein